MINLIKKKVNTLSKCIRYQEYDKIISGLIGKKLSMISNTLKPQRFKYAMLASHGVGRNALWHFLRETQAYPMRKFDLACIERTCFISWRRVYGIVADRDISCTPYGLSFINKINKKIPIFCLVRDPISIIRGGANNTILNNLINNGGGRITIKQIIEEYINAYNNMPHHFLFTTLPKQFEHITKELFYIDMNELNKNKIENTMKNICTKINIPFVKSNIFYRKIADSIALNIEKDFFIKKNNIIPLDITIKILPYENTLHKKLIIIKNIKLKNIDNRKISICIDNKKNERKINKLINNNKQILDYIMEYAIKHIKTMEQKINVYNDNMISESDIINYLKDDAIIYNKLSSILEYEVSNIRKVNPKIVDSWIHYNKFLKIKNEIA